MIEIIKPRQSQDTITHALFDFDGTLSLIREGWQHIMIPMMVDELLETPNHESKEEIEKIVKQYVDQLTGKQTMYQMLRFVEEIEKRGGVPLAPLEYKHRYLALLEERIKGRLKDLEDGAAPEKYMLNGAQEFLETLQNKKITSYLASGTDRHFVVREATLLRINHFFNSIWGAEDDYLKFSKRIAIERIIKENQIEGKHLVVFGDGYVEMEVAKEQGAVAVGVASNEETGVGIDEWKRERLISAGADIIIPDFANQNEVLEYLGR